MNKKDFDSKIEICIELRKRKIKMKDRDWAYNLLKEVTI